MSIKKLLLASYISLLVSSCSEKEEAKEDAASAKNTEMKALFEKNMATVKAVYSAFEKEDIDALAAHIDDKVEWSGPAYGDTVNTKAIWLEGLK